MLEVGWWGVVKGSFQKHLKTGVGKGKSCSQGGGGFEGVTTPAPPPRKILIIHYQTGKLAKIWPGFHNDGRSVRCL